MKITIIGNSVALRVRPPLEIPSNKNYTYILRDQFRGSQQPVKIENKSIGATTIVNINYKIDHFINSFPDWYIINVGVVDSCSRDVPLWLYRMITKKNNGLFYQFLRKMYYSNFASKYRKILVRLRFHRPWISENKFTNEYHHLISTLSKETNAKIIAIPINLANSRIENALPKSRGRQIKYNQIVADIIHKNKGFLLDTSELTSEEHYPDGVHFNAIGHKLIATKIHEVISKTEA